MKKYLSILCALAMLSGMAGMVGCSSSKESSESENSSSVTTTTTEKPTETTTQKPTEEQTTEAEKESYDLEEVHKIGNISIKLPKDCSIDSTATDSGSAEFITFPDSSVLQISETISPYSLVGLEESEKVLLLNTYAESFVSSDTWDKDSDPEETSINGCTAVKQDATVLNVGKSRLYHFLYEDSIYTIGFSKMSKTATASYDLQDDIIKSLELLGTTTNTTQKATEPPTEKISEPETPAVPTEYLNALRKADSYANNQHMSKSKLYNQLTSAYGEHFSEEAANYAIENVITDYNQNALAKADSYANNQHMSKSRLYDQLTSEYGEGFTESEAQYAVDNVATDYNYNALQKAISYQEGQAMSKERIYEQLVSEYGEGFTPEEAQYAVDNLG